MNTGSFRSGIHGAACKQEDMMRVICGIGQSAESGGGLLPLSPDEYAQMLNLVAIAGKDAFKGSESEKVMLALIKRHVANGGVDPRTPPEDPGGGGGGTIPAAGSFATHSIDNVYDLINFLKGAGVILLAASLQPVLIIPTNIVLAASFLYAVRKKITIKFS